MSKKENKFTPSSGFIVAVHANVLGIRAVAQQLDIYPEKLAEAMEKAGFQLIPDPFDLSADSGKVIALQERTANQGLKVVKDEPDSNASADREETL